MASDNMKHRRLQELGESDFEIVDGQPDIRGWDVKNESNQKIGEVEELILDAQKRKVRYLVVDLDDNDFDLDDKEVLLPIGMAELQKEDDDVIIKNITVDQLRALPEYDEDHLTPDVERSICMALGRTGYPSGTVKANDEMDAEFYDHEHFNDSNLYRQRPLASTGTLMNQGVGNAGYGLRDRSAASGNEVGGYTGDDTSYDRERQGSYRQEEIRDESAVPVNNRRDPDETGWRRDQDIDNLTGDNNRGISGDDISRSGEGPGRTGI